MGNATWRRSPGVTARLPEAAPLPPEDHPALITQAQLDRLTRPGHLYLVELIRWERQFKTYDRETLRDVIAEMTPKVTSYGGQVRNPPEWYTLDNWRSAAKALDEAQAMLDAATRTLGRRG